MGLYDNISTRIGDVAVPAKPEAITGEYRFPEDPTLLSSDEVGKWMFSLAAWNGYAIRNLALADLVSSEIKSAYFTLLQTELVEVEKARGKTKVQMESEAMAANPELVVLKQRLDEASAEVGVWMRLHEIYEAQGAVVSREISRRLSELHMDRPNVS